MPIIVWIILATFINGLVALIGAFTFLFSGRLLKKITFVLIAFSAGTLLGGGMLHLLPEALEKLDKMAVFLILIFGFSLFFLVEKFLHWHHCHQEEEDCPHPFTYLILWGDGVHNFLDGLAIAAAFLIDIRLGVITTLVIISHELPQEMGDFAVLIHGGMKKKKALLYNFISQLTSVIGGVAGFYLVGLSDWKFYLLPFAAGGFLYIAASDLIPEIKKEGHLGKSIITYLIFILGIGFMVLIKIFGE
ncbi:ZIP family metal transporter [Patescibacteria group bacterium]|nr:ZIP family metal transporter [Patescibacteria group bacterium]